MESKIDILINECKTTQENCQYNAEMQFLLAERKFFQAKMIGLIPAIIAAVSGGAVALNAPSWVGWIGVVAGVISAYVSIMNPDREAQEHLNSAKAFNGLKHESRRLHEVYAKFMVEDEFYKATKELTEQYSKLISEAPLVTNAPFMSNQQIYKKAEKWINAEN